MSVLLTVGIVLGAYLLLSLRVVKEYERGVRFFLGKYMGLITPGLSLVLPILMTWERVDMRTKAIDVPDQDAISKDNVSLKVNAVLYYKVAEANKSILEVEHYNYAVSQLAQTTMRDVVGEVSLDDLLGQRDKISKKIQIIVDKATDPWGIKVEGVELKHVELPEDMKRVLGKEAEAEREKRAVIIKAEGEVVASENMAKAAMTLSKAPGALHLRTLQSINDMSSDKSNTIVFATPLEVLKAFEGFAKKK
ncbi:slipin family protein [Candidatus Woesearchaeota archaeon]|jgi:regulator of protease activity HflC (stomatin/prohibitin superfamily)|nr:slipin family protein [Candidatus Woesearchaeota archaeon]